MILTQKGVQHKVFGRGQILQLEDACLIVRFACGEKRFVFPDAFAGFLTFEDENAQAQVDALLEDKRAARDERAEILLLQAHEAREARKAEETEELIPAEIAEEAAYGTEDTDEYAVFDLSAFHLRTSVNR